MNSRKVASCFVVLLACACLIVLPGCRQRNAIPPASPGGVTIISQQVNVFFGKSGTKKTVIWKFRVDDVSKIEANRKTAEKLLPDAIKQAESAKAATICIQAVQAETRGIVTQSAGYGYVWEKGADGKWHFFDISKGKR